MLCDFPTRIFHKFTPWTVAAVTAITEDGTNPKQEGHHSKPHVQLYQVRHCRHCYFMQMKRDEV